MKWHFWLHPLRGLAALLVILLHSYWTWAFYDNPAVRKLYLMVDFFFVLSGFVISSGYYTKLVNFDTFKSFLAKRTKRLSFHFILSGVAWLAAAVIFGLYETRSDIMVSLS